MPELPDGTHVSIATYGSLPKGCGEAVSCRLHCPFSVLRRAQRSCQSQYRKDRVVLVLAFIYMDWTVPSSPGLLGSGAAPNSCAASSTGCVDVRTAPIVAPQPACFSDGVVGSARTQAACSGQPTSEMKQIQKPVCWMNEEGKGMVIEIPWFKMWLFFFGIICI